MNTLNEGQRQSRVAKVLSLMSAAIALGSASSASAQVVRFTQPTDTIEVSGNSVGDTAFTMEARFRLVDCGPLNGAIYSEQRAAQEDKTLAIELESSVVRGRAWISNAESGGVAAVVPLERDRWHHMAYVRDGSEARLLFDGIVVATREVDGVIGNAADSARSIGGFLYTTEGAFVPAAGVEIDYVRVADAVLYGDETYEIPLASELAADANTQLLYRFNEVAGATQVIDESSFAAHGTLGVGPFADASAPTLGADACPADVDGSCSVGFDDIVTILSAWGDCDDGGGVADCRGDVDNDGSVAFSDLVAVLASWGSCG